MSAPVASDARLRALLDERSAALAQRGVEAVRQVERRAYLVCRWGSESYGLPLAQVTFVLAAKACTPVPGAPGALRGIVALSGTIVSVVDLGAALGLRRDTATEEIAPEAGHFVRLRSQEPPVALAVERVLGIAEVEANATGRVAIDSVDAGGLGAVGLGVDAVSGYAPGQPERGAGLDAGFTIVDLPRLMRRFLP